MNKTKKDAKPTLIVLAAFTIIGTICASIVHFRASIEGDLTYTPVVVGLLLLSYLLVTSIARSQGWWPLEAQSDGRGPKPGSLVWVSFLASILLITLLSHTLAGTERHDSDWLVLQIAYWALICGSLFNVVYLCIVTIQWWKSNPDSPNGPQPNLGVSGGRDPRERGSRPLNTHR
jgi:hypothetical protein